jgi:hypothetical protein
MKMLVTACGAVASAALALAAARGVRLGWVPSAIVAAFVGGVAGALVWQRSPRAWDETARRYPLGAALWSIVLVLAVTQTVRQTVFMLEPAATGYTALPEYQIAHNNLGGYVLAARRAKAHLPIYRRELSDAEYQEFAPLWVSPFQYPPPFVLLPSSLLALAGDFRAMRPLWFALEAALLALAFVALARHVGGQRGALALLFAPVLWATLAMAVCLQLGNAQMIVQAFAVLSMIAFARGRDVVGGALLGYAAVSKIHPGILVPYLLAQRRWRAAAWTGAWSALYVALALAWYGWTPAASFVREQMPAIASAKAFPFITMPLFRVLNYSAMGVVLKLELLGLPGATMQTALAAARVYGVLVLAVALLAGLRGRDRVAPPDRGAEAARWLAILCLASMQSPFLYEPMALLFGGWLLSFVCAGAARAARPGHVVVAGIGWAFVSTIQLIPWTTFPWTISPLYALTAQLAMMALAFTQAARPARAEAPGPS